MSNNNQLLNALAVLDSLEDEKLTNEMLCKMKEDQMAEYCTQLDYVKRINASSASALQKGEALEKLVQLLLKFSGNLFYIKQNVRTATNEIDIVCEATAAGKYLQSRKLIPNYDCFLGECKNYGRRVDVTYVGKFACLMQTTAYNLGILFSYHGVTGTGWNGAQGLIRKFYMSREDIKRRYIIVDFSIREFDLITQGETFLDILESKINALRLDTDFLSLLISHSAEKQIEPYKSKNTN